MARSEDLERSLRAEVENYVSARLSGQREEIERLQGQVNEAFTRLAEQLRGESLADAPVAVAISEHLRRAFSEGTSEAAEETPRARAGGDLALIKAAVEDLYGQQTQANLLNALVNRAASFAPRVAFFVVKNERATGWRARGLEGTVGDDAVRELSLPLSADSVLSEVVNARSTWSGTPGARADDRALLEKLGGEPPRRMVAVPLVARDKCVAVLYADSAGLEAEAVNLEALETLVRVAGMAVELLAARRQAPAAHAPQATAQTAAAPAQAPSRPEAAAPQPSRAEAAQDGPRVEAHEPARRSEEAPAPYGSPEGAPAAGHTPRPAEEAPRHVEQEFEPQLVADPREERGIALVQSPEAAPAGVQAAPSVAAGSFASPLGEARRYGRNDADLPVEVSEEERRYHNDARRFARLLVSEIKLYNEQKVREGRAGGDLYGRLREEIDRSRQMYEKRVAPPVAARYDYFHHELVSTLAEGNPAKLGGDYPGASV